MARDPGQLIKAMTSRRASMDAEFQMWEAHFRTLRDNIMPTRGRFEIGEDRRGSGINRRIVDSSGAKGLRTLRAGLMSGMTSPSRPWFRLGLYQEELMQNPEVKQYLETAQKRMYAVLRGSNIYRTLDACYADIGLYGTFCGLLVESFDSIIHSYAFPMGSYRIAEGDEGSIEAVHYETRRTVRQLLEQFGFEALSDRVKHMVKRDQLEEMIEICHAVEPRHERDPKSLYADSMPWASIYWEKGEKNRILLEGGFEFNPILGPRWESALGETYSISSPGMMAVGDCIQLQQQQREKASAIQFMVRPPMMAPAGFKKRFRNVPGSITTMSSDDLQKGGLRPTHSVQPDVGALIHDINETRSRIASSFFEDLFMLTIASDRRQVTAREIAERHEEKLIVLGPVLEALDHGLLQPIVETTFQYMQKSQILPPPPEELQNVALKVEFVSLLAQAQKMVGTAAIERTVGFVGSLGQVKPGALDLIDEDVMVREFADQVGSPVESIRTPEEVAALRQQRAEQAQQQQMLQNAEPMANAARLISEANERSERTLQEQRRIN